MTAETVRSISADDHRLEHIVRDWDVRPRKRSPQLAQNGPLFGAPQLGH